MGTFLVMVLFAPFVLAAWAAPSVSQSLQGLATMTGVVWVPMLVVFAALVRFVHHEYWVLTWWGILIMFSLPLLYAFSVGAVGHALVLVSKRMQLDHETSIRQLSLLLMAGPLIWFFL